MGTIYLVKVEVSPGAERAWDEWNTRHHIPEVLAEPGFVRLSRAILLPVAEREAPER